MQSRKQKDSVHSLEYGPSQSSPEVLICRLESLSKKGMGQAGEGQTDSTSHTTHLKVCLGSVFPFPLCLWIFSH